MCVKTRIKTILINNGFVMPIDEHWGNFYRNGAIAQLNDQKIHFHCESFSGVGNADYWNVDILSVDGKSTLEILKLRYWARTFGVEFPVNRLAASR